MDTLYAHARFDDLGHDARSQWVSKGKKSALRARQLSELFISIKLATRVGLVFIFP